MNISLENNKYMYRRNFRVQRVTDIVGNSESSESQNWTKILLPTSLYPSPDASVQLASVCIYVEGGSPMWHHPPPYVCGWFVSLADFCRLTPKHPWTLPPPFTFNLYQSIEPRRNRTYGPRNGRRRALFTPDSSSTLRVFRTSTTTVTAIATLWCPLNTFYRVHCSVLCSVYRGSVS